MSSALQSSAWSVREGAYLSRIVHNFNYISSIHTVRGGPVRGYESSYCLHVAMLMNGPKTVKVVSAAWSRPAGHPLMGLRTVTDKPAFSQQCYFGHYFTIEAMALLSTLMGRNSRSRLAALIHCYCNRCRYSFLRSLIGPPFTGSEGVQLTQ